MEPTTMSETHIPRANMSHHIQQFRHLEKNR